MDLRAYYRKLREIEKGLVEAFVVVRSLATADGGVAGRLTEVASTLAAKMVAEGIAEVVEQEEARAFRQKMAEEHKKEEQRRAAAQIQFTVLTESDLRALRQPGRGASKE
jgi:polyhydroxyalkanoate synthesis regulator phasin